MEFIQKITFIDFRNWNSKHDQIMQLFHLSIITLLTFSIFLKLQGFF